MIYSAKDVWAWFDHAPLVVDHVPSVVNVNGFMFVFLFLLIYVVMFVSKRTCGESRS